MTTTWLFLYFFIIVWASSLIHCWAALDLGTGVEQPFDWLVIQNHQVTRVLHRERSIDWTVKDKMGNGLLLCAALSDRRRDQTHLCKQEQKRPAPVRRRLSWTHAVLRLAYPVEWLLMSGMKVQSLVMFSSHLRIPSVMEKRCTSVVIRWADEFVVRTS